MYKIGEDAKLDTIIIALLFSNVLTQTSYHSNVLPVILSHFDFDDYDLGDEEMHRAIQIFLKTRNELYEKIEDRI